MSTYQRKPRRPMDFSAASRSENASEITSRRELAGLSYAEGSARLSPMNRAPGALRGTDSESAMPDGSELLKSGLVGRGTSIGTMAMTPEVSAALKGQAHAVAGERAFKVMKSGGRVVLLVAAALDTWEVYEAEDRTGAAVEKAGAWAAAATATKAVGTMASPLLGGGPAGWVAYGIVVGGAAAAAYLIGGEVAETLYENGKIESEE